MVKAGIELGEVKQEIIAICNDSFGNKDNNRRRENFFIEGKAPNEVKKIIKDSFENKSLAKTKYIEMASYIFGTKKGTVITF